MKRWVILLAATWSVSLGACGQEDAEPAAPTTPTVAAPPVTNVPQPAAALGCQSRSTRYPWGRAALRTWTPRSTAEAERPEAAPGTASGAPFPARLVQAYGEDYGEARRTVVLEWEDGCRRQFRAESFSDADRTLIDREVAARASVADPASYRINYRPGMTSPELVQGGKLALHTTQHFSIWYGTNTAGEFYRTIAQQGRSMEQVVRETGEWLEKQWLINRDVLEAPMPFAAGTDRQKLDIFLCGTGRPIRDGDDLEGCGASAAETMGISAWGVAKGSNVLVHEFGHMIQFYTGGFRDKGDAGMIWETGAEWNAFTVNPVFNAASGDYLNQLENGFLFSVARYGAHPIMTYLYERDATRALVFGTWLRNRRDANGATQEDYLPAFVRLAQDAGVYPNGFASFADDAGWYGARLVAMDFLNQRTMLDQLRPTRTTSWLAHFTTPLVPVAGGDATLYDPPSQRALLQWGTHIVPLTGDGRQVKVTLTGATTANRAAWRFSIVAVEPNGTPHYAPLGTAEGQGSGTTMLTPPSGTKLYLAVTATPYAYETLGWQENGQPVKGTRFPYRVKIEGATPRTGSVDACDANAAPGTWTSNYTLSGNKEGGRPCA